MTVVQMEHNRPSKGHISNIADEVWPVSAIHATLSTCFDVKD